MVITGYNQQLCLHFFIAPRVVYLQKGERKGKGEIIYPCNYVIKLKNVIQQFFNYTLFNFRDYRSHIDSRTTVVYHLY